MLIKLYLLGLSVSAVLGVLGTGVLLIETNILLDLSSTESFPASEEAVLRREVSEVCKIWYTINEDWKHRMERNREYETH